MAELYPDVAEGSYELTASGYQQTRGYWVGDLTGTPSQMLRTALDFPGVPLIGDAHPDDALLRAIRKVANPTDTTIFRVDVTYTEPLPAELVGAPPIFTFASQVVSEETIEDVNGVRLKAGPASLPPLGVLEALPTAEVQSSLTRVTVQTGEAVWPWALMLALRNRVNGAIWSGYPARTWKLDTVRAVPTARNHHYLVDYTLVYNEDTWQFEASVKSGGEVPENATIGNGIELYDVFKLGDFSTLPFTLPPP